MRTISRLVFSGVAGVALLASMILTSSHSIASDSAKPTGKKQTMRVRDLYPLITTARLFEARDFYVAHFGFEVMFEASWFVYLSGPGDDKTRGATLAFMHPDHPSRPPGPESFDGKGMILTIEVSDAAAVLRRFEKSGAPIVHPLTDEEWGQRRFMTRDPAGVLVDVVQQIEPKPGYWERYPAPAAE